VQKGFRCLDDDQNATPAASMKQ